MLDAAARLGVCAASNGSNSERVAAVLRDNLGLNRDKKSGAWGFAQGVRELLTDRGKVSAKKWYLELHSKERAQLVLDETDGDVRDFRPSQKMSLQELEDVRDMYSTAGHDDIAAQAEAHIATKEAQQCPRREAYQKSIEQLNAARVVSNTRRAEKRKRDRQQHDDEVKRIRAERNNS
jgi:hypothetical protein